MRGQANVEVYGRFADGWIAEARKDPRNQGWVLIGAQVVNRYVRNEEDEVPVSRDEGGFRRIRIEVKGRPIVLNGVRVVYTGGNQDNYPIRGQRVEAGRSYGPIELNAGKQVIDRILMRYRNVILSGTPGPGIVEVWARD